MYRGIIQPVFLTEQINNQDPNERLRKLTSANVVIGLKFEMEDNRSLANQYYSQVVAMSQINMPEYQFAQNTLLGNSSLDLFIDEKIKPIAVINFEANGFSDYEAKIIANRIASLLIQSNQFTVLERAKMDDILKEQEFQLTDCTSNECVVEVGQLLGVQLMLAGSIGRFGNLNTIEKRIIDVQTGKIVRSASQEILGEKNYS